MNIGESWDHLERLLKIRESDGSLPEWTPVGVSPELQESIKFLASSNMSQFLQEWLLEIIFQDLRRHVCPQFWQYFDSDHNVDQQSAFCSAVEYLHGVYSYQYLVSLRRLRWLQTLASSAPALADCSRHSAFTPVTTGAQTKTLRFGPSAAFGDRKTKVETGPLSVKFEEGTKSKPDFADDSLEGSFVLSNRPDGIDGSYIYGKQLFEQSHLSDSSNQSVSVLSDREGNSSKNNDQAVEEEEDPDYFIRSPIGGYKQQTPGIINRGHQTPINPNVRKALNSNPAVGSLQGAKASLDVGRISCLTSTPGIALTAHTPGITPIISTQTPTETEKTRCVRSEEDSSEETMMSVQESYSKESSSGDRLTEELPSAAQVFGVPVSSRPVPGGSVRWTGSDTSQTQTATKNKVTMMIRAILFNTFPANFIETVREFYTEAFRSHRNEMESSDVDVEASSNQGKYNEINTKLDEMGLMELVSGSAVTEIIHHQIEQHIQEECKGNFDTPYILELEEWLDCNILCWLKQMYARKQTAAQSAGLESFRDRLRHNIYETYAKSLIGQFFDIIIDYPDSKPAILDLAECLQKTDLRSELVTTLRNSLENRLLHPGVNTADILTAYIAAIKSLRLLESAGVILELVCEPVSRYLRSREDTVRCIVASLTDEGNNELVNELVKTKPPGEEEEEEDSNANWEEWMPDPVDADPSAASKSRRSADILSMLVNIYGSKELCFNEYRALLADRILSQYNCDVERELRYLELLKLRFGEAPLHFCEVMLRDVTESRRVNSRIQDGRRLKPTDGEQIDMNAMILSAQFWPAFRDEKVKLPPEMQEHLDRYTKDFETQKQNRTLVWKPHLGTMNIELELKDETLNFNVSPVQAAIIMKFQTKTKWSVDELCSELEMTPTVLRRKMAFWQGQGLIRETSTDLYMLVEERRGRPHDLIMVDEEEVESAMASAQQQKEEEMQVFWTYIQGMLANLNCLPLERIHAMLRMFAMEEPGSTEVSLQELKAFLDNKVKDQLLIFCEGVYRLNK